jgi:hypothetical protein
LKNDANVASKSNKQKNFKNWSAKRLVSFLANYFSPEENAAIVEGLSGQIIMKEDWYHGMMEKALASTSNR